eukprot:GHVU01116456.1.p1 GENE.GHVU01116456.1~~GHVU01116456.1.p1  ORF type:complete len:866 (+),score=36.68 GHVU01116456.1:787-3384(+)
MAAPKTAAAQNVYGVTEPTIVELHDENDERDQEGHQQAEYSEMAAWGQPSDDQSEMNQSPDTDVSEIAFYDAADVTGYQAESHQLSYSDTLRYHGQLTCLQPSEAKHAVTCQVVVERLFSATLDFSDYDEPNDLIAGHGFSSVEQFRWTFGLSQVCLDQLLVAGIESREDRVESEDRVIPKSSPQSSSSGQFIPCRNNRYQLNHVQLSAADYNKLYGHLPVVDAMLGENPETAEVLTDSGASHSSIERALADRTVASSPGSKLHQLPRRISMSMAAKGYETYADYSLTIDVHLRLTDKTVFRIAAVNFLVIEAPMRYVLIGAPVLRALGLDPIDRLIEICQPRPPMTDAQIGTKRPPKIVAKVPPSQLSVSQCPVLAQSLIAEQPPRRRLQLNFFQLALTNHPHDHFESTIDSVPDYIVQQEGETVQQYYARFCQLYPSTGLEGNQASTTDPANQGHELTDDTNDTFFECENWNPPEPIEVMLGDNPEPIACLLDSGATHSAISRELVDQMLSTQTGSNLHLLPSRFCMDTATNRNDTSANYSLTIAVQFYYLDDIIRLPAVQFLVIEAPMQYVLISTSVFRTMGLNPFERTIELSLPSPPDDDDFDGTSVASERVDATPNDNLANLSTPVMEETVIAENPSIRHFQLNGFQVALNNHRHDYYEQITDPDFKGNEQPDIDSDDIFDREDWTPPEPNDFNLDDIWTTIVQNIESAARAHPGIARAIFDKYLHIGFHYKDIFRIRILPGDAAISGIPPMEVTLKPNMLPPKCHPRRYGQELDAVLKKFTRNLLALDWAFRNDFATAASNPVVVRKATKSPQAHTLSQPILPVSCTRRPAQCLNPSATNTYSYSASSTGLQLATATSR